MDGLVFSFDVFDTVLTRNIEHPKDVFTLMQQKLESSLPGLPSKFFSSFRSIRILAEFYARRSSDYEDILLSDIYLTLQRWYKLSSGQIEDLMSLEMQLEEQLLVPIYGAESYLDSRRNEGQVVFISDMYLSHGFIFRTLCKYGLARANDRLYVSGEYGLTKGSGRLFQRVLFDLSVSPDRVTHLGDNLVSDVLVPRRMGIEIDSSLGSPHHNSSLLSRFRSKWLYLDELVQSSLRLVRG